MFSWLININPLAQWPNLPSQCSFNLGTTVSCGNHAANTLELPKLHENETDLIKHFNMHKN